MSDGRPHRLSAAYPALALLFAAACGQRDSGNGAPPLWDPSAWTPAQIQQLESGRRLYAHKCAACHLTSGQGQVALGAPALRGSAVATGPVALHIGIVLNGRGNGAMPAFAGALDTRSIADIINYERNAWGNSEPRLITAQQVEAIKNR
ncbi:MAG: cytochrome c [Thiogranum sp.]|jgi:cytochrome c oxidase subunit 2|nr:cytochrome c [Thiogranum sp.]